jgi:Xaa-Pro aminopeptidase
MAWVGASLTEDGLTPLAPMQVPSRLEALLEALGPAGCEALLVTDLANVRYLTGFSGSAAQLLVGAAGAVLVTDGRYRDQASAEIEAAGVAGSVAVEVRPQRDQAELLGQLLAGVARLGLEAEHVRSG